MEIKFSCTKYSDHEIMERKIKGVPCPRERKKIIICERANIPAINCSNCEFNKFNSYYTIKDTK